MPFIPVPNGIMVEVRYVWDAQRVENVFWCRSPNAVPTVAELETVAEQVFLNWAQYFQPWQTSMLSIREVYATDQSSANGSVFTFNDNLPTTGINVNEAMPNSTTLAVSLRTAQRGRSFRGRSYALGLTRNVVANNTVSAPAVVSILAGYDALIVQLGLLNIPLAICSRYALGDPRPFGILTPVVDALITDNTVDSQRRRLPGRGA